MQFKRYITTGLAIAASLVVPTTASAQSDVPPGYKQCAWWDTTYRWWTDAPEDGAFFRVMARNMSCAAAQRNAARIYLARNPRTPAQLGYVCTSLVSEWEYSDIRCSKQGRPRTAFRVQTGV